jgi:hypothetical protein
MELALFDASRCKKLSCTVNLEVYLYHPVMVKIDIMWRIIEVRALLLIVEGHPGPYMPIPYIRSIMGTIIMILVLIILYIGWGFWIQFW